MLTRKLFRTFGRYKAQFISMIIMIGLGIGVFIGFNMEWYSLEKNVRFILNECGFADYRIYSEKGFTEEDLQSILQIDGVEDASRFLTVNASVKDDADILAVTVTENSNVSGVYLMDGEPYDPESPDGFWLSDQYAAKNNLRIGDTLTLTYKMLTITGTVKGLVKAGEFLICLPDETQLMPDYNTYGFVYISPVMLQEIIPAVFKNFIGDSLYYQINVISDLDKASFVEAADKALGKTLLVLSKDETISYAESNSEIEEGKVMGSILPVLFIAIAVLTMVTTMHRITANEKTQIGTLKALGFRDSRIMVHYSSYALFIGIAGSVLGLLIGYLLGWYIMNPNAAMGTYIDMPSWKLSVPWFCYLVLAAILVFLTLIGWLSVREMLKGTAAEALQPYTPKKIRHLALEETKAFKRLNFGTKWNLRDCFRHKSRSFMTLFGIIGCMVLLIGGLGMKDTMDSFVDRFYTQALNYENRINLDPESISSDEAHSLALEYDGDLGFNGSVQLDDRAVGLEIYDIFHDLIRFADQDMHTISLSDDGAYVCSRLAKEYGLQPGSEITFSPYGSDQHYTVTITGILRSMSESITMTAAYADACGIDYTFNTVYTNKNAEQIGENPLILNVQSKKAIMDSFDSFMKLMNVMIALLIIAAVVLSLVVLYNLGIMSYTERYREMAVLKVVGFKNKKIGSLLISQNLWLSVIGILIGIPAGLGVLSYLLTALASEYEMKMTVSLSSGLFSSGLTFLVSLLVGLMVARKNRRIDMVAALKTQE